MITLRTLTAATTVVVTLAACTSDETPDTASTDIAPADTESTATSAAADADDRRDIELPRDRVFPEGIAIDTDTGDVYVGSTNDGTVYRTGVDDDIAEVFLEPGQDGRTTVTGLAAADGRLFVAGRDTGQIFAYDTDTGDLIASFDTSPDDERALINDIALTDGFAYVTDSFRPVLYRLAIDGDTIGEPEEWIDLDTTDIPFDPDGFNLNGIATSDDQTTLYTVHYGTGELFRIDTATAAVDPVDLGGNTLDNGDGLEIDDNTISVIAAGNLVTVDLDDTGTTGEVTATRELDGLLYPTTLALTDDQYLIVNSQLNMTGADDQPTVPFTISILNRP